MTAPAPQSQPGTESLPERLRSACDGHPHAKIEWPHRILHEAADRIEELTKALRAAKEFADDEFSDCGDLNRKNRICRLCDLIDRALALPLERSGGAT